MYIDAPTTRQWVVVCVIIYNAAFGYSWGPIPWLYPPEIMPLTVRAKGVSISTATNWLFNFIVGQVTPVLQVTIEWRLYPMHGFFCLCSLVLVFFLYPETKGIALEDMDAVFGEVLDSTDDNEAASLITGQRSPTRKKAVVSDDRFRTWWNRLLGRSPRRTEYTPVDSVSEDGQ